MQRNSVVVDLKQCFKEIFGGIIYSTDVENVWKDFNERFDKVNGSRIFTLHHDIGRLKQGNNIIST